MVCATGTLSLEQKKAAETLVGVREEDLSFSACSDSFGVSSFAAEMQARMEEARLSLYSRSCLASPSIVGTSVTHYRQGVGI